MRRNLVARRGAVLIAACLGLFLLAAAGGFALDLSRMFLIQKELQTRANAAALAAALQLDGTAAGLARAKTVAATELDPETVEFGDGITWTTTPEPTTVVTTVRLTAASTLPLTLVRTVVRQQETTVRVTATARMATPGGTPVELVR